MPLASGSRLGPYEILAPLGRGGMGEVYRARDPRMARDVAIKIAAEQFSDRFSREVQAVAALNHAHICTIHDVGPNYLVLELIEGDTLADRIAQGPMPIGDALALARQMAEALEAAHEKGVVHRDLKPANVKVTPQGVLKVLDFGLARQEATGSAASGSVPVAPTDSPTIMSPALTQAGVILGTAAYMAPEQARGRTVDKRADIWAFGCVLFEMLTGQRAFPGDEVTDTLAFIITKEPDWNALPATTPRAIRRLLIRCLRKDATTRLHDIADARIEIVDTLAAPEPEASPQAVAPSRWRAVLPWSLAAVAALAASWAIWTRPRPALTAALPVMHFTIPLPPGTTGTTGGMAVSPDGAQIAFTGGPRRQIFVRAIDRPDPRALAGTDEASFLSFSPDGRWISYVDRAHPSQLRKVPVAGGASQVLAEAANYGPPVQTWAADDTILYSHNGMLQRIASGGGAPQTLLRPEPKTREWYAQGQLLPGGREVLASHATAGGMDVIALNLQTLGTQTVLKGSEGFVRFAATGGASPIGHLISYDPAAGSLLAAPFDAGTLRMRGSPAPVLEGVQAVIGPFGSFAFSDSGTLAYVAGSGGIVPPSTMVWVDRTGREQPLAAPARQYSIVSLSPDDAHIAAEISEGSPITPEINVWAYDLARGTLTRVTFDHISRGLAWMPTDRQVAYLSFSRPDKRVELRSARIDGTRSTALRTLEGLGLRPSSISPDGKELLGASTGAPRTPLSIWVTPIAGGPAGLAEPKRLLDSPFDQRDAQFSSDGKWVAYQSAESGRDEIHVVSYPALDGKWQVSVDGGTSPRWAASGKELFYRNGDKVLVVDVETRPAFRPGAPRVLFEGRYRPDTYDVSADGRRFLMLKGVADTPTQLHVVVNWFEEVRRKAPLPK